MSDKMQIEDLAIFGGTPAFASELHVGRPNILDRQGLLDRIGQMLDRNWLTNNGPLVQEFEKKLADFIGVKHCVAMCNATVALEILVRAAELSGEVLVPSYTFVATAHCLQWQQITPVFCDIDPNTHNLDPTAIEQMITPRTSGIIGVHVWGRPCPVHALSDIAERHNLKLLFDAAHAFGCSYQGKRIGGFGLAEVFSFHATKFFNSFEGGAVATNNDQLAAKMRLMRNFGFETFDKVIYIGTNGKMSEVCAAMGLTSFDSLQDILACNKRNYWHYYNRLSKIPGLSLIIYDPKEHNNFQYVVIEVDRNTCGLSRDELVDLLWAENCLARKYFWPGCHRMEPYKSLFPHAHLLLPNTKTVADRVFLLPTGTTVGPEAIDTIADIIETAVTHAPLVRQKLRERLASRPTL